MDLILGISLALAAAAVWAVAPVLYRRGVERVSYTGLGAFRCVGYLLSAGLYLLAVRGPSGFVPLPWRDLLPAMVSGVIWLVAGDLCYFAALHKLGVTVGVPVTSAFPVVVVMASWVFLDEPVHLSVFLAAACTVLGIYLLSPQGEGSEGSQPRDFRRGLVFALGTVLCWCFGVITNKLLIREIPIPVLEWWRAVAITAASWLAFVLTDRTWRQQIRALTPFSLGEMALAGALGLTVGNLLYTYSLRLIPVSLATCVACARPFLAALFAVLVLREHLSSRLVSGIGLVAAGVLVMSLA